MKPLEVTSSRSLLALGSLLVLSCSSAARPPELVSLRKLLQNKEAMRRAAEAGPPHVKEGQRLYVRAERTWEDGELDACSYYSGLAEEKFATAMELAGRLAAEARRASAMERIRAANADRLKAEAYRKDLEKRIAQLEKIHTLERRLAGAQGAKPQEEGTSLFDAASALTYEFDGVSVKQDQRGVVMTLFLVFGPRKRGVQPLQTDVLDAVAALADEYDCFLMVEGYTDSRGRRADNLALSQGRAQAVTAYLVQAGKLDFDRVKSAGYGASNPISDNSKPAGRVKNRRIEIIFLR